MSWTYVELEHRVRVGMSKMFNDVEHKRQSEKEIPISDLSYYFDTFTSPGTAGSAEQQEVVAIDGVKVKPDKYSKSSWVADRMTLDDIE